ncbi:hypothetical protein [Azospirillum largimobile]
MVAARWTVVLGRRCDAGDRALFDRLEEPALTVRQAARQFGGSVYMAQKPLIQGCGQD